MRRWTAVTPLKLGADAKSRLASCLDPMTRAALTARMAAHVLACLEAEPAIERRLLLASAEAPALHAQWAPDLGRGLNAELDALREAMAGEPLVVVHADLPFLAPGDVAALLRAAEEAGTAIAPDRLGVGTNAVASVRAERVRFAFGEDSHARHRAGFGPQTVSVTRDGLAFDLDTPDDLAAARLRPAWTDRYATALTTA